VVVDRFNDPLLTTTETARHLLIPQRTLNHWLAEEAGGAPLVHRVDPERRGWPTVPFIAVVEAYVLRSLRDLGLTKRKIRDAAAAVRGEFGTAYALATKKIVTDGIDIFWSTQTATWPGWGTSSIRSGKCSTAPPNSTLRTCDLRVRAHRGPGPDG
jgi:hypothetical protein